MEIFNLRPKIGRPLLGLVGGSTFLCKRHVAGLLEVRHGLPKSRFSFVSAGQRLLCFPYCILRRRLGRRVLGLQEDDTPEGGIAFLLNGHRGVAELLLQSVVLGLDSLALGHELLVLDNELVIVENELLAFSVYVAARPLASGLCGDQKVLGGGELVILSEKLGSE